MIKATDGTPGAGIRDDDRADDCCWRLPLGMQGREPWERMRIRRRNTGGYTPAMANKGGRPLELPPSDSRERAKLFNYKPFFLLIFQFLINNLQTSSSERLHFLFFFLFFLT